MTYPQAIRYLEGFINYEKIPSFPYKESLKLERISNFLDSIGNPQDNLKFIHIAGTKGKGSTCAFVAYILRETGFKVGLYTSPHLSDFRERIRILHRLSNPSDTRCPISFTPGVRLASHPVSDEFEGMISKAGLARLVEKLRPAIDKFNVKSEYGPLTFFEIYTTLAFIYFNEKKVDFAVLETGLGGRLDATNVVNPLVCAITSLSYEHTQKLGNTLREIAREKAGIIKFSRQSSDPRYCAGTPSRKLIVITAPQEKEALEVIRNKCKQVGAKLYEVGEDINYKKAGDKFRIKGIFGEYLGLKTKLLGEHQLVNATVAIGVIEGLRNCGINIGLDAIKRGIYHTLWPGRCEVVSKKPLIVLDGAQNVASAGALKKAVKGKFKYKKLILVLGISSDKDIKGVCNELHDLADIVILSKADNPRATKPKKLAEYFKDKDIYITDNVKSARIKARELAKKEDLVLVTGSLFVVGEFRNAKR